jgi:hypothetical protein
MEEGNGLNNRRLYAPGCYLSASGIGFEPEAFLAETVFYPKRILFRGKMGFRSFGWVGDSQPRTKQIFEYRHLILLVSNSDVRETQLREALLFVKKYQDEVLRLSNFPNVEQVLLQFSVKREDFAKPKLSDELLDLCYQSGITFLI